MATTSLKLSSKTDATGRSQVIVKLTISRTNRPCFKSGVFVNPDWFKPIQETKKGIIYGIIPPKKGRLNILEVREAEEAKSMLDSYISKLVTVSNALSKHGENVTHDDIVEAMRLVRNTDNASISYRTIKDMEKQEEESQQEAAKAKTFFECLDLYLKEKELSEGRKKSIRVLCRMLARYQQFIRMTEKNRKDFTLDIHTIDSDTVKDFFDYASNEKSLSEEYPNIFKTLLNDYPVEFSPKHKNCTISERGHNLMIGRKKMLKAFFMWLLKNNYTDNNPFAKIEIGSEVYGTPYYLTLEERNIIADWDFSNEKQLETQRDIFIFQCCIGCRVSDLMSFTDDNLVEKDGVLLIEYIPRKTKDGKPIVIDVPLNDRAMALVAKYKGTDTKGRLFPFIGSQNYNENIKKIMSICGITRKVAVINPTTGEQELRPINEIASSHMARRTFVGNLYKQVKDPNLVGSLSGHCEGSRAFARYRDIDMDIKKETVSLIN